MTDVLDLSWICTMTVTFGIAHILGQRCPDILSGARKSFRGGGAPGLDSVRWSQRQIVHKPSPGMDAVLAP